MVDYNKVEASPVWGTEIGRLYMNASPFITTLARHAYAQFADQVEQQYRELVKDVRVTFLVEDEMFYPTGSDLFKDIESGHFLVSQTTEDQRHPLLGYHVNDMFRAVHDYHGHFGSRRGFDRHGEEAAWVRHSQMFTGLARRAMTTETRGQNSALCWVNNGVFPQQKAILLPDWVSRVPECWSY